MFFEFFVAELRRVHTNRLLVAVFVTHYICRAVFEAQTTERRQQLNMYPTAFLSRLQCFIFLPIFWKKNEKSDESLKLNLYSIFFYSFDSTKKGNNLLH